MKLGIMPPYMGPTVADPDWVREFCLAMEADGVESVWAVEHVVMPTVYGSTYPYDPTGRVPLTGEDPMPDPLEWIAFAAGVTTTLNFGTAILILPEHNPVHLAKRLSTIQVLSNHRLILGIGVGWLEEEFNAVGVPFAERGARTDEYVAAMRTLWREDIASFDGRFTQFDKVRCRPQADVPIYVGGHTPAAARRAGRLGDGFYPLGVSPDELKTLLDIMRAESGNRQIDVMVASPRTPDDARAFADLGVSRILLSVKPNTTVVEARAAIDRYRERIWNVF